MRHQMPLKDACGGAGIKDWTTQALTGLFGILEYCAYTGWARAGLSGCRTSYWIVVDSEGIVVLLSC